jgi:hypothetical protein
MIQGLIQCSNTMDSNPSVGSITSGVVYSACNLYFVMLYHITRVTGEAVHHLAAPKPSEQMRHLYAIMTSENIIDHISARKYTIWAV